MKFKARATAIAASSLLLMGAVPGRSSAQLTTPMYNARTIRVSGQGEVRATPDLATVNFGVQTVGSTAEEASQGNAATMQQVIQALTAAGVARNDIRTTGFSVYPEYAPDRVPGGELEPPRIRGYRANNQVTVRTRDLTGVGELIDIGLAAGANNLGGVGFEIENSDAVQAQALTEAVTDARRAAETIAAALGVRLGAVLDATTDAQPVRPMYREMMAVARQSADSTPVEPGEQTVFANASLVFAIE